jgi:hypothetical protein
MSPDFADESNTRDFGCQNKCQITPKELNNKAAAQEKCQTSGTVSRNSFPSTAGCCITSSWNHRLLHHPSFLQNHRLLHRPFILPPAVAKTTPAQTSGRKANEAPVDSA